MLSHVNLSPNAMYLFVTPFALVQNACCFVTSRSSETHVLGSRNSGTSMPFPLGELAS
jgi:hypothetical protein